MLSRLCDWNTSASPLSPRRQPVPPVTRLLLASLPSSTHSNTAAELLPTQTVSKSLSSATVMAQPVRAADRYRIPPCSVQDSTMSGAGDAVGEKVSPSSVGVGLVGAEVGLAVGLTVGLAVGFAVGLAVGFMVGFAVGDDETVGFAVGLAVGLAVGFDVVGDAVGFMVGFVVGIAEGLVVG